MSEQVPYPDPAASGTPATTGYPVAGAFPATPAPNPLGRVSLALGIVLVVIGVVQGAITPALPLLLREFATSAQVYGVVAAVIALVELLIAIPGLVTGIVALRRPGAKKAAAGAGTALATATVVTIVTSYSANLALSLIY